MRRRFLILPASVLLLALGAVGGFFYQTMNGAVPVAAPAPTGGIKIDTVAGEAVLTVPLDMQRASGIAVSPLAPAQAQSSPVYASVIDPQALVALGTRLAAANAELDAARTQAGASAAQAARMETLYQDERNASQKSMQEARAAAQSDRARLVAGQAALTGAVASVRLQFGEALARMAATPGARSWLDLAGGRAALLRVVLPSDAAAPARLLVDAPGGAKLSARKLSSAPQVDPMLQGADVFYLVAAAMPAGLRTIAHAASARGEGEGVLVPDAAIVWYGDTRWVYLASAPGRFTRRLLQAQALADGGIVVATGLRAGDRVVTRGAALLLSEEQRPRGIATQCKDPPECDD